MILKKILLAICLTCSLAMPVSAAPADTQPTETTTNTTDEVGDPGDSVDTSQYKQVRLSCEVVNQEDYSNYLKESDKTDDDEHYFEVTFTNTETNNETAYKISDKSGLTKTLLFQEGEYKISISEKSSNIEAIQLVDNGKNIIIDQNTKVTISEDTNINFQSKYKIPKEKSSQKETENFWMHLLKNNFIFLILIIGCGVALFIIDNKKKNMD